MSNFKRMQELFAAQEKRTLKAASDLQSEIKKTEKSAEYLGEIADGAQQQFIKTEEPVSGFLVRNMGGFVQSAKKGQESGKKRSEELKTKQAVLVNQFGMFKKQGEICMGRHRAQTQAKENKSSESTASMLNKIKP